MLISEKYYSKLSPTYGLLEGIISSSLVQYTTMHLLPPPFHTKPATNTTIILNLMNGIP